jgi:hypothetical protein
VLPGYFEEAHWSEATGVTNPESIDRQVELAVRVLAQTPATRRVFLYLNVSALHQPNKMYLPGALSDSKATHAAALRYVDSRLPPLFEAVKRRGPTLCLLMSDHGTCYDDDGYTGHRLAHPAVWTVPYAELVLG